MYMWHHGSQRAPFSALNTQLISEKQFLPTDYLDMCTVHIVGFKQFTQRSPIKKSPKRPVCLRCDGRRI